ASGCAAAHSARAACPPRSRSKQSPAPRKSTDRAISGGGRAAPRSKTWRPANGWRSCLCSRTSLALSPTTCATAARNDARTGCRYVGSFDARGRVVKHEFYPRPEQGRQFVGRRRVRLGDVNRSNRLRLDAVARYLQDVASDDVDDLDDPRVDGAWVLRRTALSLGELPRYRDDVELTTFCSGTGSRWAERRTILVAGGAAAGGAGGGRGEVGPARRRGRPRGGGLVEYGAEPRPRGG